MYIQENDKGFYILIIDEISVFKIINISFNY